MMKWICQECGEVVVDSGALYIFNANPEFGPVGGYPQAPSADLEGAIRQGMGEADGSGHVDLFVAVKAIQEAEEANPPNVGMLVCHDACDPLDEELAPYTIAIHRIATAAQALDWAVHLTEKTWFGHRDLKRFLMICNGATGGGGVGAAP